MKNYWNCVIGPIDRDKLPWGSDSHLRMPVKLAFKKLVNEIYDDYDFSRNSGYFCSSGWGVTGEQANDIFYASNNDETKLQLIKSYYDEGKSLPRGLRAWELLFKKEGVL